MSEPSLPANACPKCGATLPVAVTEGLCPRCLMVEAMVPTHPAAEPAAPQPTLAPAALAPHFPQLEILQCLGRGGMGVVYLARQKALNRLVALKVLAPERVLDPRFAGRFAREAQALAALNHPNIVTIHDFGQTGGLYFLLMEYVDGVNLRQAMKAGRFTPEQALAIVPPVCEALQYAHDHGIVHRDIKPENLLLDKDGRVKIADFGIAKMLGENGARLGSETQPRHSGASGPAAAGPTDTAAVQHTVAGTPQYTAPEQRAEPQKTDHRADIYSLGIVLYELLTGELPGAKLQPPSRKVQIDVRLDEIVLRALEAKPELRYQTAAEFRTQVETFSLANQGSGESASDPKPPTTRPWPRRVFWFIVTALAIPFGLLAVFLLVPQLAKIGVTPQESFTVSAVISVIGMLLLAVLIALFRSFRGTAQDADNPWPRRLFWSLAALLGTPLVLFGFWLLTYLATQQAGGKKSESASQGVQTTDRKQSGTASNRFGLRLNTVVSRPAQSMTGKANSAPQVGPFIAELPNGLSVELVALSRHPSTGQPWWKPDGTPATETFDPNPVVGTAAPNPDTKNFQLIYRLSSQSDVSGSPYAECNDQVGFIWPWRATQGGKELARTFSGAAALATDDQTTDVRIGVATGPWEIDRALPDIRNAGVLVHQFDFAGFRWKFDLQARQTNTQLRISGRIPFHSLKWWTELVVIGPNGAELRPSARQEGPGAPLPDNDSVWFDRTYEGVTLAEIYELRFRARPYQWVQFRDVSLEPGRKTDVIVTTAVMEGGTPRPSGPVESAASSKPSGSGLISPKSVQQARADVERMESLYRSGRVGRLDLLDALYHLKWAEAMSAGDPVAAAQSKVDLARERLKVIESLRASGRSGSGEVAKANRELVEREAELGSAKTAASATGAVGVPFARQSDVRLEPQLLELHERLAKLRVDCTADHPDVVATKLQISEVEESLTKGESIKLALLRGQLAVLLSERNPDSLEVKKLRSRIAQLEASRPREQGPKSTLMTKDGIRIEGTEMDVDQASGRVVVRGHITATYPPGWRPAGLPLSTSRLSYQEFDQAPGAGWRALSDKKRFTEAAAMIASYLATRPDLSNANRATLHFHAAQCLAFDGSPASIKAALTHLSQARLKPEPPNSPVKWNDYVDATEAFLKGELQALKAARERIAQGPKANGEIPNLGVVDRLIARFGQPYATAYGE